MSKRPLSLRTERRFRSLERSEVKQSQGYRRWDCFSRKVRSFAMTGGEKRLE